MELHQAGDCAHELLAITTLWCFPWAAVHPVLLENEGDLKSTLAVYGSLHELLGMVGGD